MTVKFKVIWYNGNWQHHSVLPALTVSYNYSNAIHGIVIICVVVGCVVAVCVVWVVDAAVSAVAAVYVGYVFDARMKFKTQFTLCCFFLGLLQFFGLLLW